MDELKLIFASNLIKLRNEVGMTQAELGEKLNYSDKSVSKWERAESVPDIYVVKQIADIFGVTVDRLLTPNDQWKPIEDKSADSTAVKGIGRLITLISLVSILSVAVLVFAVLWIVGIIMWQIFVYSLPVAMITWLVLNSVFNNGKRNRFIVMGLLLSIVLVVFVAMRQADPTNNPWQLFIALIPLEAVVWLAFVISSRRKSAKKFSFYHE